MSGIGALFDRLIETNGSDLHLSANYPPMFRRGSPRHTVIVSPSGSGHDDVIDNFYPQASSQWDSLAHVGFDKDVFYNGATAEDIQIRHRNTIGHWASRGIVGRAVLRFDGQLSVFKPHEGGPCYRCLYHEAPPPGMVPSCSEAGVLGAVTGP